MFIGEGGSHHKCRWSGGVGPGNPPCPLPQYRHAGIYKRGSGGGRRALLSHHLSKGQIKKHSQGPGSWKTIIIVLCHLLGELQVLLLTLPALLESKGQSWWQVGTEVTSFPWLQRPW